MSFSPDKVFSLSTTTEKVTVAPRILPEFGYRSIGDNKYSIHTFLGAGLGEEFTSMYGHLFDPIVDEKDLAFLLCKYKGINLTNI